MTNNDLSSILLVVFMFVFEWIYVIGCYFFFDWSYGRELSKHQSEWDKIYKALQEKGAKRDEVNLAWEEYLMNMRLNSRHGAIPQRKFDERYYTECIYDSETGEIFLAIKCNET